MSLHYVYILSNKTKTVFYIDSTENIEEKVKTIPCNDFARKFKTVYLLYYKCFDNCKDANDAKFLLRRCSRLKQDIEIKAMNPDFQFLTEIK